MQTYTLSEARNRHGEVFDQAAVEPVLLTKQSRPSYVLMSAESYQQLIDRLTQLEDMLLGQTAEEARNQSQMVGTETFTKTLRELAN
ncbi:MULTISPECIES: type II toxin-antitoxin system Phd/YefM family antitoxin [Planktothricoides]|uniref:Antitoxin n=2 Tax=Planktothricoides raciborskii TaxID=132608 RepID=A0AAU8JCP4_9CYAN|nr:MULTISPECIES: type II toxin-antitoxin system Phd/YefM family antitoxin [Planktothricoides]KOR37261.1 prevent-host-death protein [Planktothricoides sp. SR001]MBD2542406.1 type II toxin-antitoxin system Phd/YefM family antitoxin [Planktothricoides raciborskii FACHB-1370]MBD2582074.1 type II toxin-antitoxin system Phd/YefM family antitoxin [Planktothricoides raciborskii FACHB-1261]